MILKSWRITVFGETMENVRKHRDINQTERKIHCLVSEPNYQNTKFFTKTLVAVEMKKNKNKKTEILTNKPVYLGLSILLECK